MHKNRQVVLQNPFHPLDLSAHDLLAVYKRFEQSRLINRNPKQQLPVETIAQMISSLKGCPPSYIQKCISQALIKETISWNQFLTFLDQQSEVREKILQWLMYEKSTVKYKQDRQWPFRGKIGKFYEEITFLKFLEFAQNERLILCSIDKVELILFLQVNGRLEIIDSYANRSQKVSLQKPVVKIDEEEIIQKDLQSRVFINESKFKKGISVGPNRSMHKSDKSDRDKILGTSVISASRLPDIQTKDQQQQFYRKERKNINSLFNIFKDLDPKNSITYAKLISQKISQKNFSSINVGQLRQAYAGAGEQKVNLQRKINQNLTMVKPLQKAKGILRDLHREKRILSYNPHMLAKHHELKQFEMPKMKKLIKQRKQKQYNHEANQQVYNSKLKCIAIIYFNMEVALVKVVREYNKISLQEQDKLKITTENQHKKNEVIQCIDFYFHSIVNKWFLIVLIRVEYKNQFRNQNQSYIRGYQIQLIENKRRGDKDYRFKSRKQAFSMSICHKTQQSLTHFQIFNMQMQMQYGIHFISVNGRYICFREDFIQKTQSSQDHIYFTFYHQQKFKNAGLSLSCFSFGVQNNKIVFGTIRGIIIVYDMFSHHFKTKKIANAQIVQLHVVGQLAYLLTLDEKMIIYDLSKGEEIQHFSVRNEDKLHQKIMHFQMNKNYIFFYGTEVRSYTQIVDHKLLHQRRKMQTIYKWRLDKLFKQESAFQKQGKYKGKQMSRLLPPGNMLNPNISSGIEMVISSDNYFLVLSQILQLIVIEKKTLKIKFTMILGIPHDSKVMKMALSHNQKLLALLLFNQNIYIFNIHTQDQYSLIRPSPYLKYTALTFLDPKNQYLLATGSQNGKVVLAPYSAIPEKNSKVLDHHKDSITCLVVVRKQYLVSCGEDFLITIWLLPFNVLKHQIRLQANIGFVLQEHGSYKQLVYLRTIEGNILQINTHDGKIVKTMKQFINWNNCIVDSCTGQFIGISNGGWIQNAKRGKEGLELTGKVRLQAARQLKLQNNKSQLKFQPVKGEVKYVGIIQSEKAVIFMDSGLLLPWAYQSEKLSKKISLCQQ